MNEHKKENTELDLAGGLIKAFFGMIVMIGAAYTGYHTYNLYSKGLGASGWSEALALIPVGVLEGVILLVMLANMVYFVSPEQKFLARFSWIGLIILAINTMIDHNINAKQELPWALQMYSLIAVPVIPIIGIMYVKLILEADPAIKQKQEVAQAEARLQRQLVMATAQAYDSETVKRALELRRDDIAEAVGDKIIQGVLGVNGGNGLRESKAIAESRLDKARNRLGLGSDKNTATLEAATPAPARLSAAPSGPAVSALPKEFDYDQFAAAMLRAQSAPAKAQVQVDEVASPK